MDVRGNKSDTDSPCIGVCSLTVGGHICRGCGRNLEDVTFWAEYSNDQKREINMKSAARLENLEDPYNINTKLA